MRIRNGDNPLDASAVHPEAYPVVKNIAQQNDKAVNELIGKSQLLNSLNPNDYISDAFGLPTIVDILQELDKPALHALNLKACNLKKALKKSAI